jgi:hypothetical protein
MSTGILKVKDTNVVDENGKRVILRGAGLGGWLNMENFITGYPGHESQHRAAMLQVLGQEKYDFFFDRWLEAFFTEGDAKYFASLGLNCIRIPFNYRHFEDDMNPRVLKEEGFKHLDRAIELVSDSVPIIEIILTYDSALSKAFIPSWICTRYQVDRTRGGTLTMLLRMRHSGTIRTIKTAPSGSGRKSLSDTRETLGLPDTIPSMSRVTHSTFVSPHSTTALRRRSGK